MQVAEEHATIKRNFKGALKEVLDEAGVPMKHHLRVLQAFQKKLDEHAKDRKRHEQQVEEYGRSLKEHRQTAENDHQVYKQSVDEHVNTIEGYRAELGRFSELKQGLPGEPGLPGRDGVSPDIKQIVEALIPYIPAPLEGKPGADGKAPELGDVFTEVVKRLKKEKVIHISDVAGSAGFIKDGIKYRYEELMHGGGSSTGSLSGTQEKSTTVPNGVLTSFAFAHTPKVIVWNGAVQTLTDDYTISGLSITFTASAGVPQTGDKIVNIYG